MKSMYTYNKKQQYSCLKMILTCHAKQFYTLRRWYFLVPKALGEEVMFTFSVHTLICQHNSPVLNIKEDIFAEGFFFG